MVGDCRRRCERLATLVSVHAAFARKGIGVKGIAPGLIEQTFSGQALRPYLELEAARTVFNGPPSTFACGPANVLDMVQCFT